MRVIAICPHFGSARNAWLRSPNPSNGNNVRNVNTDGSLNNNNAYNGNGAAVDCENCQYQVAERPKQHTHTRSGYPLPEGKTIRATRESFEIVPLPAPGKQSYVVQRGNIIREPV